MLTDSEVNKIKAFQKKFFVIKKDQDPEPKWKTILSNIKEFIILVIQIIEIILKKSI